MAEHSSTATKAVEVRTRAAFKREWTDLEPKVIVWVSGGGLLTVAGIVYGIIDPNGPVPQWVTILVPFLGGFVVAWLKASSVRIPSTADAVAAAKVAAGAAVANYTESNDAATAAEAAESAGLAKLADEEDVEPVTAPETSSEAPAS